MVHHSPPPLRLEWELICLIYQTLFFQNLAKLERMSTFFLELFSFPKGSFYGSSGVFVGLAFEIEA